MLYSDLPGVYIMGYIPYVGFATHRRATVRTHLCLYIKKKKGSSHYFLFGSRYSYQGDHWAWY
jgi:hypothetical protein